ncbi:MAG: hypothetical protein LBC18_14915 [Opitutaceae bacterium]|jgi:hypothetical protein|nr:hypothetical protein [Opitutaceae bacterium]
MNNKRNLTQGEWSALCQKLRMINPTTLATYSEIGVYWDNHPLTPEGLISGLSNGLVIEDNHGAALEYIFNFRNSPHAWANLAGRSGFLKINASTLTATSFDIIILN